MEKYRWNNHFDYSTNNIIGLENPCRACNNRNATCHCACEKYLYWKSKVDENRHLKQAEQKRNTIYYDSRKRR